MWSVMSHKSSSIFSVVMAERDESLSNPLHLIHMSICLLSMPLSKDYWCPTFDIWHIMCHNFSSHELTWRRGQKSLTDPFFVSRSSLIFCLWVLWHSWFIGEVRCYLTFEGLTIMLSGACHLTYIYVQKCFNWFLFLIDVKLCNVKEIVCFAICFCFSKCTHQNFKGYIKVD